MDELIAHDGEHCDWKGQYALVAGIEPEGVLLDISVTELEPVFERNSMLAGYFVCLLVFNFLLLYLYQLCYMIFTHLLRITLLSRSMALISILYGLDTSS